MSNQSSSNAVLIGGVVAALIIGAFIVGYTVELDSEGPAENLGASIDNAAGEISQGLKEAGKEVEKAAEGAGN